MAESEVATPPANEESTPAPSDAAAKVAALEEKLRSYEGTGKALQAEKEARARVEADLEAMRQWKAEREGAELSEVDRLKKQAETLKEERDKTAAELQRERLANKYPNATAKFEPGDALPSEETLAKLEKSFAPTQTPAEPSAPPPPNPGKERGEPAPQTAKDLLDLLDQTPLPKGWTKG